MSSFGQVKLKVLWKALSRCAPGSSHEEKTHKHRVTYNGRVYPDLPKGAHGTNVPEIEFGHVKKMIRHLMIDPDCMKKFIPGLGNVKLPP